MYTLLVAIKGASSHQSLSSCTVIVNNASSFVIQQWRVRSTHEEVQPLKLIMKDSKNKWNISGEKSLNDEPHRVKIFVKLLKK